MKFKLALLLFLSFFGKQIAAQKTATLIYIDQYKDIAIQEMKRTGIPASITLAQGIVESNSGESNLALNFNNHFGIKCKSDWKGETTYQDDDTKQECFRVYPNAMASFIDHSNFIKNRPNYAPLFQLDPVDDSAWAIGLKKAGYATASDYPKKIMKVIDDYELSQYNFPELNDENDSATFETDTVNEKSRITPITTVTKNTTLEKKQAHPSLTTETLQGTGATISINKDTVIPATKNVDSAYKYSNQASLQINNVKGIEQSNTNAPLTIIKMNSIGKDNPPSTNAIANKTENIATFSSDTIAKSDKAKIIIPDTAKTSEKKINSLSSKDSSVIRHENSYSDKPFKINQVSVIWAKAGTSFLQIATENNIPLYKIFVFNDLEESELLKNDQLLFLGNKKTEGDKSFHLVVNDETLYEISQKEGIQLKKLKEYNPMIKGDILEKGLQLLLVKPKEQKSKLSLNK
jgi:LysM repeat protein